MLACPQSDTFYNKVTKKRKRGKVRESCLLFSPVTHLSPSSFKQDAHPTLSQFHQSTERLRVSRVSRCARSRARFWPIGIATTSHRYRDGKKNNCVQHCRHHWTRRSNSLQFVATVSEENEYRGLTSLSESRVVNLKAVPLSTEDGRNARSFIIEIIKEKKSRKTKFNWKEKVYLISRETFTLCSRNHYQIHFDTWFTDTFQLPGRFKNETKVESVDVSKDENEFPTRALDLLENRETNDKQKREVEGSRSTTVGWFRARFSWVNDLLVDLTLELFLVYTYLRTGPLDTI